MTPKPLVLVVEDDELQRSLVSILFEECEMEVIECDSAEAAREVLEMEGRDVAMIYADVHLRGDMNGIELAEFARRKFPDLHVIVTSGDLSSKLPPGTTFMPKPWRSLELLCEVERLSRG